VIPPCPGIVVPKSLILNALLNPDAKNPPKGAMMLENNAINHEWSWIGAIHTVWTPKNTNGSSYCLEMYNELTAQVGNAIGSKVIFV